MSLLFFEKNIECPERQAVFGYVYILPNFHLTMSLPSPPMMPRVIQPGGGSGKMRMHYTMHRWPCCRLEAYVGGGGYYNACRHVRTVCNPVLSGRASFGYSTGFPLRKPVGSDKDSDKKIMSLVYAKKSDEIWCARRVFLHACAACGTEILMWRNIKNQVATLCTRVYLYT